MMFCPFGGKLLDLLADILVAPERDVVVRHVEDCVSCRERLGRLTDLPSGAWRRTQVTPASAGEEALLRRLKRVPPRALRPAEIAPRGAADLLPTVPTSDDAADASVPPSIPGYEIVSELGRGGMGVVYKARQLGLHRTVAIKMIRTASATDERELARFRAEAAAIARLHHPNIVQIHDTGEVAGRPYLVLEFVSGGSLAEFIQGRPQPIRAAAELVGTLAQAVHVAHQSGVIHRDLKPGNILLETVDEAPADAQPREVSLSPLARLTPKITDFGVAKCAGGDCHPTSPRSPTTAGELVGTPNYMSPEQATIPRKEEIGPASDVYSLGAILYEMLTGRPPFLGESSLATIFLVLDQEPVTVSSLQPSVPRDLETICHKCLRKDSRRRYPSALALAEDLERFLKDEPIRARPVGTFEKLWRAARNHPLATGLLAAGLLAPVVALTTLSLLSARLVRSSALESAVQQAELLEEATKEYSRIVQRVEKASFKVNKTIPPTPGDVPLSIPATFLHEVGAHLSKISATGVKVRQYSDFSFPFRTGGGAHDAFERDALTQLSRTKGKTTVHAFEEIDGHHVVRYVQARTMEESCVQCHNNHPQSPKKDWKLGDVRGVLEIIRPLDMDESRVADAFRLALLLSAIVSGLLLGGSLLVLRVGGCRV